MATTAESIAASAGNLEQQVSDAVANRTLPISQLLRLMWALDADQTAINAKLRAQLRARIGAPLDA